MLGFSKPKKTEVLSHWYSLVSNFNASTKDFYKTVEDELKVRKVPGLEMARVEFAEGGILSDKREYLRMTRERLVFDVCAAPFGTAFFFSCRFAEIPAVVSLWQWVLLLVVFGVSGALSFIACSHFVGALAVVVCPLCWLVIILLAIYVMRNASATGFNLDAILIQSPIVGSVYERWLRRETYYRQDTRLMYCDTVNAVVKNIVEETTAAKGVKLVQFNEYNPILTDLYKPSVMLLKTSQQQQ